MRVVIWQKGKWERKGEIVRQIENTQIYLIRYEDGTEHYHYFSEFRIVSSSNQPD